MPLTLPLPFAADYARWKSIVSAIAHGRSAMNVAKSAGVGEPEVIANLPFLKATGIVAADSSQTKIHLSMAGSKYASAVFAGDIQAEKGLLAACPAKALKPAIRFCELQRPDFEKLFLQLKFLSGIPDSWGEHMDTAEAGRMGICTAIEIMGFAEVIDQQYPPEKLQALRAGFRTGKMML